MSGVKIKHDVSYYIDTSVFSNWILVLAPVAKLLPCIDLDKK